MTYKTTGTLKEIGAKVGDVVERPFGVFKVTEMDLEQCKRNDYTIISRATHTGPVRTVMRKEIVPGVYGRVAVGNVSYGSVELGIIDDGGDYDLCATLDCDELETLIQHLKEIRDAL